MRGVTHNHTESFWLIPMHWAPSRPMDGLARACPSQSASQPATQPASQPASQAAEEAAEAAAEEEELLLGCI